MDYGTLRHQRDNEKTAGGLYKLHDVNLNTFLFWLCQCLICQFIVQKCSLKSLLYGCYAHVLWPMRHLCRIHSRQLDSGEQRGSKATLGVNLKNCGLRNTVAVPWGVQFVSLQKGAYKCLLCGYHDPLMCPFPEPDLVQNSQQATSQYYVTKGRPQGLRTVLPGQGHWNSFRQLNVLKRQK